MPYLYVAKVNLNSSIFNAYNNNPCIQGIMEEVYNNIQDDIVYETEENAKYSDSLGNEHKYVKKSQYSVYGVPKRNADRPVWGNCAAAGGNINR